MSCRHLPRRIAATLLVLAGAAWIARDAWGDGQAALSTILAAVPFIAFGFWLFDRAALQGFATWAVATLRSVKEAKP